MKYDHAYIGRLLAKYLTEGLSKKEQAILDEWIEASDSNRQIFEEVRDPERFAQILEEFPYVDSEQAWRDLQDRAPELLKRDEPRDDSRVDAWMKAAGSRGSGGRVGRGTGGGSARVSWVASGLNRIKAWIEHHRRAANFATGFFVAALAVITFVRIALHLSPSGVSAAGTHAYVREPLSPAGYNATLQLAGGPVLELANLALGFIGSQGGLHFTKTEDGKIVITSETAGGTSGGDFTAALTTPKGAWFTAVLADGTTVNLNAGSTLEMHTSGGVPIREVTLRGEAFFDVAKVDGARPFVVHVEGRTGHKGGDLHIISLGTRFNVKAYEGGNVLTSLDQGRIELEKDGRILTTLDPGEAVIMDDSGVRKVEGQAAASCWKDGKFDFEQKRVDEILADLSRWYDARIEYTDKRPITDTIYSLIGFRKQPLDTLVKRLSEGAGFHYKIDAGTIYVWH